MTYTCPVCGYDELIQPPKNFYICDCCGTEFENDDFDRTHQELRDDWIARHMPWFSKSTFPPRNWSPYRQLIAANFGPDLIRHARMKTDEDYRYAVDEAWSDVQIARQLKLLRETRAVPLTQKALADRAEMKQSRISELEGMNYSAWSVSTLKRLARALGVRFRYSFASWKELLSEIEGSLHRETLAVPSFEQDLAFAQSSIYEPVRSKSSSVIRAMVYHLGAAEPATELTAKGRSKPSGQVGQQMIRLTGDPKQLQMASVAGLSPSETTIPLIPVEHRYGNLGR
jgi:transcriptional regulator with XRE-family HTH domain